MVMRLRLSNVVDAFNDTWRLTILTIAQTFMMSVEGGYDVRS